MRNGFFAVLTLISIVAFPGTPARAQTDASNATPIDQRREEFANLDLLGIHRSCCHIRQVDSRLRKDRRRKCNPLIVQFLRGFKKKAQRVRRVSPLTSSSRGSFEAPSLSTGNLKVRSAKPGELGMFHNLEYSSRSECSPAVPGQ